MSGLERHARVSLLILCLQCLLSVAATAAPLEGSSPPLSIAVAIPPLAYLTEQVGGDLVSTVVLVEDGQSPHGYEPRPRQLVRLAETTALFTIGLPIERQVTGKLRGINPGVRLYDIAAAIERRTMVAPCPHAHHDHASPCAHGDPAGATDPHLWLSPTNAIMLATAIREALQELLPTHVAELATRCSALVGRLRSLDERLAGLLRPVRGTTVYVFHPAFGYFTDRYGLTQRPVEIEGKEPSPRQLAALIRQARAERVRTIFVQRQFSNRAVRHLADTLGAAVVPLDPLQYDLVSMLDGIGSAMAGADSGK